MRYLLSVLCFFTLCSNTSFALNSTNLEKIVKEIEDQESELHTLNTRKFELKKKLETTDARIAEIDKRKLDLSIELRELQVRY